MRDFPHPDLNPTKITNMTAQNYTLLITKIECLHTTNDAGSHDEIYLRVYPNDDANLLQTHFKDSPLSMDANDASMRYVDLSINATYLNCVKIDICESDSSSSDDRLGYIIINRNDALEDAKNMSIYDSTEGRYKIYWRVISKPIPTVRVFGIMCEHSSEGCNAELISEVAAVTATVAGIASEAMSHVKTPKGIAISKGLGAVSDYVELLARVKIFKANLKEGRDEVYLQHVANAGSAGNGGGAFCPPDGSSFMKMNNGDQIIFEDRYQQYFRFPLDAGPVTIQLREGDRLHRDVCMGALTIDDAKYNELLAMGATVMPACEFNSRGNTEGAVYYLCYGVALEDWAFPATADAQGNYQEIALNQTLSGTWSSTTQSIHRNGRYAQYYSFSLTQSKTVRISLDSNIDPYLYLLRGNNHLSATVVTANDDGSGANSRITATLSAGDYLIEATTYARGSSGNFTVGLAQA